ncbi:hypothetical protein EW146_g9477 [Bondarzewia mesenterica]|uniref:Uncharacterized protein n=1 Tax=Bondarzewia mesenterica TaxID=1095465 RepID=A0A4S4LB73_9AGAM|nr:hypothetical protein EW146_g9477 [Bondarzewia mesenterica]
MRHPGIITNKPALRQFENVLNRRGACRVPDDEATRPPPSRHADRMLKSERRLLTAISLPPCESFSDSKAVSLVRVSHLRQTPELHPGPGTSWSGTVYDLSNSLFGWFEQTGQLVDLEEVLLHRQALDLSPDPHPNWSSSLHDLSRALHMLFNWQRRSIDRYRRCDLNMSSVARPPTFGHPPPMSILVYLGENAISDKFASARDWARCTDGIQCQLSRAISLSSACCLGSQYWDSTCNLVKKDSVPKSDALMA